MNKKLALVGLSLGLTAGGVAGLAFGSPTVSGAVSSSSVALAATDTTTTDTATADAARPDRSARLAEVLAPLVADGTITQDQADKVVAALAEAGPLGGGRGGGMRGGPGLEAAATALGVTEDELRTELQGGSSIAEVAAAKGVDVQTVIDSMVASATERINAKVADGSITQAEADTKLADLTQHVTDRVNGVAPEGGMGGGMGRRGGHGGDDADADTTVVDATTTTVG